VKKPSGRSGRRHLDDDEAADWEHTARSIEPLKRAKGRVHAAQEQASDDSGHRPRVKAEPKPASPHGHGAHHARTAKAHAVTPSPAPAKKAIPPVAQFDRKKAKKIRAGHIEIEARIDLHGMRQDEAHAALRAFLFRTQARGLRWVLVITGKGVKLDDDHDRPFDMTRNRDRGVLKRNVPRWLEEPDLRHLIVSYTSAAIPHGGDGALYVHLRKRG
jgi:DNA-nicking Smr family endonuclease